MFSYEKDELSSNKNLKYEFLLVGILILRRRPTFLSPGTRILLLRIVVILYAKESELVNSSLKRLKSFRKNLIYVPKN